MAWCLLIYSAIFLLLLALFLILCDGDFTLLFWEKFGKPLSTVRGKVYWVVGASSGIGEFIAYELAANGAKVVISARREDELQKVKTQCLVIGKKSGIKEEDILILPVDVTKLELHKQYFDTVIRHFGTLDVLINNAGRSQRALWQNIEIALDRELFETNVFGLLNLTRTVLPHFLAKKAGQVAVMSSVCGKMGPSCSATYNATKHALHGYFETLRSELSSEGICVTMLCPGPVFSDLLSVCATDKAGHKLGESMNPKDRRMQTDRCAHLCLAAIVNRLDEAWMIINPVLFFTYFGQYAPSSCRWFMARFGSKLAMKLRDSRTDLVNKPSGAKSD